MSSRDMTLTELKHTTKTFDDTHTVSVNGFKDGGSKITAAYVLEVTSKMIKDLAVQMNNKIDALTEEMRKGFNQINARIDNLVAKNNLKE